MWQHVPLCFELLSPVHIGFLPNVAGTAVAPSRFYVPGKNVWGAVTASLTPRLFDRPGPAVFAVVGDSLKRGVRFSYFYLSDGAKVYSPSFRDGDLTWSGLSDSEFRTVFAGSRLSTQLGTDGTAEDGGLHEIEYIRHRIGPPESGVRLAYLCGVLWFNGSCEIAGRSIIVSGGDLFLYARDRNEPEIHLLEGLVVGGERNYGFGRIRTTAMPDSTRLKLEEWWPADPEMAWPIRRPLLSHMRYDPSVSFRGDLEIIASREYPAHSQHSYVAPGRAIVNGGYYFAPGTWLPEGQHRASLDQFGQLSLVARA